MTAVRGSGGEAVRAGHRQHTARRHHMTAIRAGADPDRTHHHCIRADGSGRRPPSRRAAADEPQPPDPPDAPALGAQATPGIDLAGGAAAPAVRLPLHHDRLVHRIRGRARHRARESHRGEADRRRGRRRRRRPGPRPARPASVTRRRRHRVISPTVLTGRRRDPAAGRTRTVDRLRARPAGPGPQRAFHPTDPTLLAGTGPFTLLTGCPHRTAVPRRAAAHWPARAGAGRRARPGHRGPAARAPHLRRDHRLVRPGSHPRRRACAAVSPSPAPLPAVSPPPALQGDSPSPAPPARRCCVGALVGRTCGTGVTHGAVKR